MIGQIYWQRGSVSEYKKKAEGDEDEEEEMIKVITAQYYRIYLPEFLCCFQKVMSARP